MFSTSDRRSLTLLLFSAIAGFAVSFTLFFVFTLKVPFLGLVLLDIPPAEEGAAGLNQQMQGLEKATSAMGSFWWWTAVVVLAVVISFSFLRYMRGEGT